MSITSIKNEEVIFVSFLGLGVCLKVEGNTLVPVTNSVMGDTAEVVLNNFRDNLSEFIDNKLFEIQKAKAVLPLVNLLERMDEENGGMPPDLARDLISSLDATIKKMTERLGEARELMLDVTDLMIKYGITIKSRSENDDEDQSPAVDIQQQVSDLLARIRKKQ